MDQIQLQTTITMESSLLANDEFVIESDPNDNYNYNYSNNTTTNTTNTTSTNSNSNTSSTAPTTTRTYPIVQVIAPETLAQGYTFDVEFNHEILSVVVVRTVLYWCRIISLLVISMLVSSLLLSQAVTWDEMQFAITPISPSCHT